MINFSRELVQYVFKQGARGLVGTAFLLCFSANAITTQISRASSAHQSLVSGESQFSAAAGHITGTGNFPFQVPTIRFRSGGILLDLLTQNFSPNAGDHLNLTSGGDPASAKVSGALNGYGTTTNPSCSPTSGAHFVLTAAMVDDRKLGTVAPSGTTRADDVCYCQGSGCDPTSCSSYWSPGTNTDIWIYTTGSTTYDFWGKVLQTYPSNYTVGTQETVVRSCTVSYVSGAGGGCTMSCT